MLRRVLWILCVFYVLAAPRHARGGAFLLPEGKGQFIAGIGYIEASHRFNSAGMSATAPADHMAEASGYLEYGLTSTLSIILAPTMSHDYDYASPSANAVTGSNDSAFGARFQLYGAPGRVFALQALFEPMIGPNKEGVAADVRLMLGQSFSIAGYSVFVDIDPGVRLRTDADLSEARLDLTAGVRPVPRVLLLVQDFSSFAPAVGPVLPRQSYSKVQTTCVYDFSQIWSVQVGAFRTIMGRNAPQEIGPLAALWYRF